jgi:hypothetical protein
MVLLIKRSIKKLAEACDQAVYAVPRLAVPLAYIEELAREGWGGLATSAV